MATSILKTRTPGKMLFLAIALLDHFHNLVTPSLPIRDVTACLQLNNAFAIHQPVTRNAADLPFVCVPQPAQQYRERVISFFDVWFNQTDFLIEIEREDDNIRAAFQLVGKLLYRGQLPRARPSPRSPRADKSHLAFQVSELPFLTLQISEREIGQWFIQFFPNSGAAQ